MTSTTLVTPASSRSDSAARAVPQALVRAHRRAYVRAIFIIDTVVVVLAVVLGYLARFQQFAPTFGGGKPGSAIPYVLVVPGLVIAWLASLRLARAYHDRVLG